MFENDHSRGPFLKLLNAFSLLYDWIFLDGMGDFDRYLTNCVQMLFFHNVNYGCNSITIMNHLPDGELV